jgi:hypothetical protein
MVTESGMPGEGQKLRGDETIGKSMPIVSEARSW